MKRFVFLEPLLLRLFAVVLAAAGGYAASQFPAETAAFCGGLRTPL